MIGINLANDSLGIGQQMTALTSATGTELCGSKPTCVSITSTCKEKNRVYNECRMKSLDLMALQSNNSAQGSSNQRNSEVKETPWLLYGGIGLVILIIIVALMMRSN